MGPTTPMTAPLLDENAVTIRGRQENVRMAATRLVRAINMLGEPALSIPCGKGANEHAGGVAIGGEAVW